MTTDPIQCPKCGGYHGNDWSQCGGSCPMPMSPHYKPAARAAGEAEPVAYLIEEPNGDKDLSFGDLMPADREAGYRSRPLVHPAPTQEPVAVPAGQEIEDFYSLPFSEQVKRMSAVADAAEAWVNAQMRTKPAAPVSPPADSGEVELKTDFAQSLPGGKLDDSTYFKIEDALDRIDAPMTGDDGRWLSLHERIVALASTPAPQPGGAVKVKALEWLDGRGYQGQRELIARDLFGNEFAHLDYTPGDAAAEQIDAFKSAKEAEYQRAILSALEPSSSQWNAGAEAMKADILRFFDETLLPGDTVRKSGVINGIERCPLPTPPAGEG